MYIEKKRSLYIVYTRHELKWEAKSRPSIYVLTLFLTFMGVSSCMPASTRLTHPRFPWVFFVEADDSAEDGEPLPPIGCIRTLFGAIVALHLLASIVFLWNLWLKGWVLLGFAGGFNRGDFGVSAAGATTSIVRRFIVLV